MKKKYEFKFDFAEKDVENALISNMDEYLGLRFIRSQWNTPAGVIEIIARSKRDKSRYYVIEVKKDEIDSHAYCQSHRYAAFLNHNYSKDGERYFIPMVIGQTLSGELTKIVKLFDEDRDGREAEYGSTYYALYYMDIKKGLAFSYYSPKQREYENEYLMDWTYCTQISFQNLEFKSGLPENQFRYEIYMEKADMLMSEKQKADRKNQYPGFVFKPDTEDAA